MNQGLVSTIIPVFNRPRQLVEAVDSVLEQTYRPLEIIIVDDGSTDRTTQELARHMAAKNDVIRVVTRQNGGPGAARETGRQFASGEFIQYLDSDDLLLPQKFQKQVEALQAAPQAAVAYGLSRYLDLDGNELFCDWKPPLGPMDKIFPAFLRARMWDMPSPLYRREVCDRAGAWLPLRIEEDWEYDARIGSFDIELTFIPEVLAIVRQSADRLSGRDALNRDRLRDRALAHQRILEHARTAAVHSDRPEMQHFGRELFLLARQCGAAGLAQESERLLTLAAGVRRAPKLTLYRALGRVMGFTLLGRASSALDRLR